MAGLTSLTGYGDDGIPYKTGISYGDPVARPRRGGAIALGSSSGGAPGQGTRVDLAQREGRDQSWPGPSPRTAPATTPATGNRHPTWAPQGSTPRRGQWIAFGAGRRRVARSCA